MVDLNEIWTEKYRPRTLDEVVGHEFIVERLKAFAKQKNIPNLLFAGPAGVGKTTSALALARDLYGENWKNNFLEMNASDERGIDIVRGKIKDFARVKPLDAPFKIIFLDESDALTPEAQQALRRTMEKYTHTTRFILSCNYSSKIIPPIQSRCAILRFKRIPDEKIEENIKDIAKKEGLDLREDGLKALISIVEGDMRNAINLLQSIAITSKVIDEERVYEVAAVLKPVEVKEIMDYAVKGDFLNARKYLSKVMLDKGLSGTDVIKAIHREILNLNIDDKTKARIIDKLGEAEFRIVEGGSDDIQLEAFLASILGVEE